MGAKLQGMERGKNVSHSPGWLINLAQTAKKRAGEMTVDDLIASIERSAEADRRAYSRYRNFNMVAA